MNKLYFTLLLLIALPLAACSSEQTEKNEKTEKAAVDSTPKASPPLGPISPDEEVAVVETGYGKFKIRFYDDIAPKHVAHFKELARQGFYDGLGFHRVIADGIIQGGDPTTRGNNRELWGMGEPGQKTVEAEFGTRPFVRGTVGAARKGNDINSATSQFFICLDARPEWNGKYTVFGEVYSGLGTVQAISKAPTDESGQKVVEKVPIFRIHIEKAGGDNPQAAKGAEAPK
jgi:cyclophilin family peptidyl-prolyl cis-trans isomerase